MTDMGLPTDSVQDTFLLTLRDAVEGVNGGDLRTTVALHPEEVVPVTDKESTDARVYDKPRGIRTQALAEPYRVVKHIASGGLAVVDAAIQNCLDREVAIKRVREDRKVPSNLENLVRESQLLARLDHPNITPVYALAYDETGEPLIVMKRIKGRPWTEYIGSVPDFAEAKDPLRFHLSVLCTVCRAVEYAHSLGIVHLDLKTDNVMVGEYGEVYLLDWGVAVELDEHERHMMDTFYGTPRFAAPEMFNPRQPLTRHTDVYLLGGILHEILVNRPLHDGRTLQEIIFQANQSAPKEYGPQVPPALASIVHQATAKACASRFDSVQGFRNAVQRFLDNPNVDAALRAANHQLSSLNKVVSAGTTPAFEVYRMAFECRYAFLQVLKKSPGLDSAKQGLIECVRALFLFVVQRGLLVEARPLLKEILALEPSDAIRKECTETLKTEELRSMRSKELNTQIQYKLLEQLQQKTSPDND